MNHQKIYNDIIQTAKFENRKKLKKNNPKYSYYENHHIIPRCLGGSNDKENLVLLTAREHYVCHKLLTYIYTGNRSIVCAFFRMTYDNRNRKVSSRDYEYAKKIFHVDLNGEKNPMYKKSFYDMWIKKYGKDIADKKLNEFKNKKRGKNRTDVIWNKGKKLSEEHKNKLKKPLSEEHKKKIGNHHRNKITSEETKKKQSLAHKGKFKEYMWIVKDTHTKFVHKEQLLKFIENGWKKGRKF